MVFWIKCEMYGKNVGYELLFFLSMYLNQRKIIYLLAKVLASLFL